MAGDGMDTRKREKYPCPSLLLGQGAVGRGSAMEGSGNARAGHGRPSEESLSQGGAVCTS